MKLRVGVVGATGYVGQRFVTLLADHPWFELHKVIASPHSAGKPYAEAVAGRWKIDVPMPSQAAGLIVQNSLDYQDYTKDLDLVFCAVNMNKADIVALEEGIAKTETPLISNNSANRWTPDVPMIIPEINADHSALIKAQRKRLGTRNGFIACKPNCSIQSYVPALTPLLDFEPESLIVSTYQAISGAGKTFADWPEMDHNLIPFIGGEEEKSEKEPMKIWGSLAADHIELASRPLISAQCYRVAVQEGHTASVAVKFRHKPDRAEIIAAWKNYIGEALRLQLPSAPQPFLTYREEDNRPQPQLDAMTERGMGISIGRLREDPVFDYKFCCLSHNTLRGAAGGGVLMAELLYKQGYIRSKQA
ncbi:MAG: aspartate-semialdehyde dehydrogenase [Oscillospiraceae bacterium]|nr:aspartate-semialdehyde dehydrogenase [Oscillospiraceae bacterium]MDD4368017.1 aspartate-semialdehyde dehydrogenase [Oscillospiraceae bacterium]